MTHSTLYFSRTGNSLRAAIAVELAGIEVDRQFLDMARREHKAPEFLAINPAGAVPVYVDVLDSGEPAPPLAQSGAILEYLLSRHRPDLVPDDPLERAQARAGVLNAVSDIGVQNALLRYLAAHAENAAVLRARLLSAIAAAFSALPASGYLGGAAPNIVDFAQVPVIYMREAMLRTETDFAPVMDWLDRMREIEAVRTAIDYAGLQFPDEV